MKATDITPATIRVIAAPLTTFLLGLAMAGTPSGNWAPQIRTMVERLDRS